jgi:hypothetical protein
MLVTLNEGGGDGNYSATRVEVVLGCREASGVALGGMWYWAAEGRV